MSEEKTTNGERHFCRSENIGNLATALAEAQGKMQGAAKDSANPFFKSRYADLASCWEACRAALSKSGLAVIQTPRATADGIEVETMLAHSSGEWVSETLSLPVQKSDAQGIGSAITYARRYSLCAIVGVAPEDDDGNQAVAGVQGLRAKACHILDQASGKGLAELELAWKTLSADMRRAAKDDLQSYKEKAAKVVQDVTVE